MNSNLLINKQNEYYFRLNTYIYTVILEYHIMQFINSYFQSIIKVYCSMGCGTPWLLESSSESLPVDGCSVVGMHEEIILHRSRLCKTVLHCFFRLLAAVLLVAILLLLIVSLPLLLLLLPRISEEGGEEELSLLPLSPPPLTTTATTTTTAQQLLR